MIEIKPVVLIPFPGVWPDKYCFPRYYIYIYIYFKSLQHIRTWVAACACVGLLFCTAHAFNFAHLNSSGASQPLCFRGNAWLRRWVETARGLGEISSRSQSVLMTQMKYEGIVRERAERKHEGSSLIPASFYDGYVSSLALWLSRKWRVASVCFCGARRDVTARRTTLPPPKLPLRFTHLFFVFTSPLLLHRAMESLSSWPAWRFSHKSPAAQQRLNQKDVPPVGHFR